MNVNLQTRRGRGEERETKGGETLRTIFLKISSSANTV